MTSEVVLPIPPFVASAAADDASSSTLSSSSPPPAQAARPPRRKIFTEADLAPWFRSNAYADLERTILRMTAAVQGKSNKVECFESEPTKKLAAFLHRARDWVAETPLAQGPQRFGNKAFRDWLGRLEQAESAFQRDLLDTAHVAPNLATTALPELSFHLLSSFGSPQRLDYGTGHELSFLCYLVTLCRLRVFAEPDEQALVVRVFAEYIELCRQVQKVFRLEPAGSKGVWGLDDHQHLVYLFGASQLVGHPKLRPASLLNATDIASHAPSSLFLSSIAHIHALKRGPFHEHSPLLHQIATTVPSWHKVTKGLWDMYKVEVLGKVPVVQHCRFGEVGMRWTDPGTGETLPSSGDGRADDEGQEEQEEPAAVTATVTSPLDGPLITPAPWARTTSSSSSSASSVGLGTVRPLPPPAPGQIGTSTTVSSAPPHHYPTATTTATAASSAAHARRQHPMTFPLAPPPATMVGGGGQHGRPVSFAPPTLFPPRASAAGGGPRTQVRSSVTLAAAAANGGGGGGGGGSGAAESVADQGGAAASSSPFGVLPPARLGSETVLAPGSREDGSSKR